MIQTNPFKVFYPPNARYLVLGSFVAKDAKTGFTYEWYYANGRNQFWPILEQVYGVSLKHRADQEELFKKYSIAMADIILSCERTHNSSLDTKLTNITYNIAEIEKVLKKKTIKKVMFTSRFVESHFKKHFQHVIVEYSGLDMVTLPSPSPRYASMSFKEKIAHYAHEFPLTKF